MKSQIFLAVVETAALTYAKVHITGSTLGSCNHIGFDRQSFLPVCLGEVETVQHHIGIPCLEDGTCHRTAKKPAEVFRSANPLDQSPYWSAKPSCIREHNSTESYCIYTSSSFAGGRGISIFTSPEHAEEIINLPAFTNSYIHDRVNYEPDPPYVAKELPGRGIGLIVNRTLHRGDRIFSSTPAFIIEETIFDELEQSERHPFQNLAVRRLPSKIRKSFLDLCGHFGGDIVEDIVNTNSFSVELFDGEDETTYNAVFPEMSRMNHDCRPNAHYYFDPIAMVQHVHALRTIVPGEELTISYMDQTQTRKERLSMAKSSWGFQCGCSLCSATAAISSASDDRIDQIHELRKELEDYSPSSEATPAMAEFLVSLYEQEQLWGPIAEAYTFAAITYNGVGDLWTARKYATLAIEVGMLWGGPDDDQVEQMESLLRSPESHWSWKIRSKK